MSLLFPRSKKIRGLIDCDSFFASCEIYRHPKRQGMPVCVGRQIVVAATYEAKAYGVQTGTPVWEAKKMLPDDAIFCPPDFLLYGTVSDQLADFLSTKSNDVQPASIDEAFIDLTDHATTEQTFSAYANQLKHEIKAKVGIPVSIGIGQTKLLAKIGASYKKPFGSCVMLQETTIQQILTNLPVSKIPFIGKKTAPKLTYRCNNAEDFRQLDYYQVKQLLGRSGCKLRGELNGYDTRVRTKRDHQQAISRTRSFDPDFTSDPESVRSHLVANIEKSYAQLVTQDLQTKGIAVMLRTKSFHRPTHKQLLSHHTTDKHHILRVSKQLFKQLFDPKQTYRSTGIYLFDLAPQRSKAQRLFDTENSSHHDKELQQTIQQINQKRNRPIITAASAKTRKRTPELFSIDVQ